MDHQFETYMMQNMQHNMSHTNSEEGSRERTPNS